MHFSHGEIIFAIFFVSAFAIALTWSYRRDRTVNAKNFPGGWKVILISFIILTALSLILKVIHSR